MPQISNFVDELKKYKAVQVFNPWSDCDSKYDLNSTAPEIRTQQLDKYLRLRIPQAKYILIAEALGYQGGHFTGIAMTSERILLGNNPDISPKLIIDNIKGNRTSSSMIGHIHNKAQGDLGFNEPTATVVWGEIMKGVVSSFDILLWNIFPFHPFKLGNILTNRPPTENELKVGLKHAMMLINLCPNAKIVSIGKHSATTLDANNIDTIKLRHPSYGGISEFRSGFKANIL